MEKFLPILEKEEKSRKILIQNLWKVPASIFLSRLGNLEWSRSRISWAALFVKVIAKIFSLEDISRDNEMMRPTRVWVFPVPGPATIKR